jgi:general L-amino acid transport system permease protein
MGAVTLRAALWVRRSLFGSWLDALLTLAFGWLVYLVAAHLLRWAVLDARLIATPEECRQARGACWAAIVDLWQLFLVGIYPYEERWRPLVAALVLIVAAAITSVTQARRAAVLIPLWGSVAMAVVFLLRGTGSPALPVVDTARWGGLMLTVVLGLVGQSLALPLGLLLALGRTNRRLTALSTICTLYIEIVRSVPLVLILLMTFLILPLFFPPSFPLDAVVTAQVGIILFSAASIAEVVRGGLAGVPPGQAEAASALGLKRGQVLRLVILPQALRIALPALVSTVILFVKGSSLVVVIGLYDLLGAAMLASTNERWVGTVVEPLVFVGLIFWIACFSLSEVSRHLEQRFSPE